MITILSFFQGLAFLRKDLCDVKEVEFARAVHVIKSTMEQISYKVPRVKVGVALLHPSLSIGI